MKSLHFFVATFFASSMAHAQLIKDSFGKPRAINETTMKVVADASKREPGWRYGFNVDFQFVVGQEMHNKTSYLTQLEKIVIHKEKGFFNQYYSEKAGKFYTCDKLSNLCETTELNGITINATWEYEGKEYKTGAIQMHNMRDDKSYLRKPVSISPPGGGVIPWEAVKSGAAKVVKIEVTSWSFTTTDAIMDIIQNSK